MESYYLYKNIFDDLKLHYPVFDFLYPYYYCVEILCLSKQTLP